MQIVEFGPDVFIEIDPVEHAELIRSKELKIMKVNSIYSLSMMDFMMKRMKFVKGMIKEIRQVKGNKLNILEVEIDRTWSNCMSIDFLERLARMNYNGIMSSINFDRRCIEINIYNPNEMLNTLLIG